MGETIGTSWHPIYVSYQMTPVVTLLESSGRHEAALKVCERAVRIAKQRNEPAKSIAAHRRAVAERTGEGGASWRVPRRPSDSR